MIKINGEVVTINKFPDGTPRVNIDVNNIELHSYNKKNSIMIEWFYESDDEMFYLMLVKKHLERLYTNINYYLSLPYIPNARMDRVKNDDEVFTLKYFCEFINWLGFSAVCVLDAHSDVSTALLNNCIKQNPKKYVDKAISKIGMRNLVLYFPDAGAAKRYSDLFPELPYCYGEKKRDWKTGKILGLDIRTNDIDLKDKAVLMMSCMDEATRCSASWLLSFNKTSTIPAINYIDRYYNADCKNNGIGIGAVSTEHSVMGANFSIDGDEITFVKRLLTELYPNTSFSMVSDTYDYWNMVNNILPQCKEEIMNHNGKLLVRPDSGDIVEISVKTVEKLWEIFGGSVNGKGYKVLDPHIGIIYGDGCTLSNVETIWEELEKRGFAANNIAYGVGAFCFTAIVENGKMIVVTRDTFGIAMKATYGVIDDKKLMIFKDPKTDTSHLKKSHKGCCRVYDDNGELKCQDQLLEMSDNSLLTTVFKDGELVREDTFADIRNRMYGGK